MRRLIRWVDADGTISLGLEFEEGGVFARIVDTNDPLVVLGGEELDVEPSPIEPENPETLELGGGRTLLAPLDPPEVWCAGVTYQRSRDARMDESAVADVYQLVYDANRPELFLKDAGARRTVGPGAEVCIRNDSLWNVPEPEIGLVLGERGRILGYTVGNDVSSREIEGANPLYLSQAKVYARACAIGPAVYVPTHEPQGFRIEMTISTEDGEVVFEERTTTAQMVREFGELTSWLVRDNPVPAGTVLLTGTGIVPPDTFSLEPGHIVRIHVPEIGALVNPVALAASQ